MTKVSEFFDIMKREISRVNFVTPSGPQLELPSDVHVTSQSMLFQ